MFDNSVSISYKRPHRQRSSVLATELSQRLGKERFATPHERQVFFVVLVQAGEGIARQGRRFKQAFRPPQDLSNPCRG